MTSVITESALICEGDHTVTVDLWHSYLHPAGVAEQQ
jgi:hypothetical protein